MHYKSIEQFKNILTAPMYGNKYKCSISSTYTSGSWNALLRKYGNSIANIVNDKIECYASSVVLPSMNLNPYQYFIGGHKINVVNAYDTGMLDIKLYNDGDLWKVFNDWKETTYSQRTNCYGYWKDYVVNLFIDEYNCFDTFMYRHEFYGCNLYIVQGITLSYSDASEIESFDVNFGYERYLVNTIENDTIYNSVYAGIGENMDFATN